MAVNILGVNPAGYESGNDLVCDGRDLPWLQETTEDDVWGAWVVAYRDVVILGTDNVRIRAYNLTAHDLGQATNRDQLKGYLREAAGVSP